MFNCYLTEQQKKLLRSITPGLRNGDVETQWNVLKGSGKIVRVRGLPKDLWDVLWSNVSQADLDDFAECGFFRWKGGSIYTLNRQKIIDAVDSNFGENESAQLSRTQGDELVVRPNFGPPLTGAQYQCDVFMVMPFKFIPIYDNHIKPIVEAEGLDIKLGNDFFSKHDIIKEIWSAIYNAKFLIADCTDKNANVFYELGIAHMLDKPVIMITQNADHIPFDVQSKRYILYENGPAGLNKFETELKTAIMRLMSDLEE